MCGAEAEGWCGTSGYDQAAHGCGVGGVGKWACQSGYGCGWGIRQGHAGCELARAPTHLLQLQPHSVEGSQPVGLGPGQGVLTLLTFLRLARPETEARGIMRLQGPSAFQVMPGPPWLLWPFRDTEARLCHLWPASVPLPVPMCPSPL